MYTNGKSKAAAILCYFTPVLWLLALLMRDPEDALSRHHMNQAFALVIAEAVAGVVTILGGLFAVIGNVADVVVGIFAIIGIVRAAQGSDKPLPWIPVIDIVQ